MAERKTKRNARQSKRDARFRVCSEPIVPRAADAGSSDLDENLPLPRVYDFPILFAIARDDRTIFAGWNIDWQSVFQKSTPVDRKVYLRLIGSDGLEKKKVAVEPMLAAHYLTIERQDDANCVEIGYYQPDDKWQPVATSNLVKMPVQGTTEFADVDVATIPFHLRFQQLANVLGATNDVPLAKVVAGFQKNALNNRPNDLPPASKQILGKLNLSLPAMAAARSEFRKIDTIRLAGRGRALLQIAGTSPSRAFEGITGS